MSNTRIVDSDPYKKELDPDYATPDQLYTLLREMGEIKEGETVVVPVQGMGGQVTETGTFMFNCAGIYAISHPKKITLHSAASFGGSILGAIKTRMRGIGKKMSVTDVGMCGKDGQGAPVSDGSHPYLLMDKTEAVTFGGA